MNLRLKEALSPSVLMWMPRSTQKLGKELVSIIVRLRISSNPPPLINWEMLAL
jgi:hypothetical protein